MRYATPFLVLLSLAFADRATSAAEEEATPLHLAVITSDDLRERGVEGIVSASLAKPLREHLVDRAQIDQIRKELDLAAFCAPQAVRDRQALARAISADMLAILRTAERSEDGEALTSEATSQIQVVIVDCRYGVRLADRLFDDKAASFSELIPKWIDKTHREYSGGIKRIVGFTPLVPEGEQGRVEQLHVGLPRLLETAIAQNSSIIAMQSEETRLIERERTLGAIPNASVPITIVSGSYSVEFRTDAPNQVHVALDVTYQGKERRTFSFTLPRDDYAGVSVSPLIVEQVVDFLYESLAVGQTDGAETGRQRSEATLRTLLNESRRQAVAGTIDEVISIGEAALLLDPKQVDVRWLLIGAYRRKLRHRAEGDVIRIVNGRRVSGLTPTELRRERLRHHAEYLIRNRLVNRRQGARILRLLYAQSVRYWPKKETVDRGPSFPTRPARYSDPDFIRSYRDLALELLARVADAPERTPYDSDDVLEGYALGPVHVSWQAGPRGPTEHIETELWMQTAIELKDDVHFLASRMDPKLASERAAFDEWAFDYGEKLMRNGQTKEDLTYFVVRHVNQRASWSFLAYLHDHPEMLARYRGLYESLTDEAEPRLQLLGQLGLFTFAYKEMRRTTDMHPPRFFPEEIEKTRRHLQQVKQLAIECGVFDETGPGGESNPARHAIERVDRPMKFAMRIPWSPPQRAQAPNNPPPSNPPARRPVAVEPKVEAGPHVVATPIEDFGFSGWFAALAIDDATDLIHEPKRICLMSRPGILTPIFSMENRGYEYPQDWIYRVHYDGRWIWLLTGNLELLAIDRQGKVAAHFDLPPMRGVWPYSKRPSVPFPDRRFQSGQILVAMTSSDPGHVWLAGFRRFEKSSWVARACVGDQPGAKGELEIVHRAERQPADPSPEAQLPMDIMFKPSHSLMVLRPADGTKWLLVPRCQSGVGEKIHSFLWIDVEKPSNLRVDPITVLQSPRSGGKAPIVFLDDAIFFARQELWGRGRSTLLKVTPTKTAPPPAETTWREERIGERDRSDGAAWLFDGDRLHYILKQEWLVIDPETLDVQSFAMPFEDLGLKLSPFRPFYHPYHSAHYGIVLTAVVIRDQRARVELFRIRFSDCDREVEQVDGKRPSE
jgi:hypothetical protein